MIAAPQPKDEFLRLQSLRALNVLDTPKDYRFEMITQYMAKIFEAPICLIALIDHDRQWFKSAYGLNVKETSRSISFCGHSICDVDSDNANNRIIEVHDTLLDERFFDNPIVTGEPFIRSYIAYVLQSDTNMNIGTLCVDNTIPKIYSHSQKQLLILFGTMTENLLHGRHHLYGIEDKYH